MNSCDMRTCVMCYQGICLIPSSYERCPYTKLRARTPDILHIGHTKWELRDERLPIEEGMYLLCSVDGEISVRYFNPKADTYNVNGLSLFNSPSAYYWLRLFIPAVPVEGECEI